MSSVQHLREFIKERLTAAAEEIFTEVEKTIVRYEKDIKLLETHWKPQIKLTRIDLQKPHVSIEKEAFAIPRVCNQEMKSSHGQVEAEHRQIIKEEEPEPTITEQWGEPETKWTKEVEDPEFPLINKEQEESDCSLFKLEKQEPDYLLTTQDQNDLYGSQDGEQLVQKQFVALMETPTPQTEQILFQISPVVEGKDQEGSSSTVSETQSPPDTKKRSFKCDICGKCCKYQSELKVHYRTHTGERPFPCQTCGKKFSHISNLNFHIRIHTGERPFSCQTCGKNFTHMSTLIVHKKIHTGERPFS
ncbi:PREDICTED: zinc finger and SCAN domain-containing protein 2-like, partial [Poecilia mexicana]|uniref:zinc finger and SCAN domain-containing protein 2-like n=1 Tax=Poecilia mexicana TaxID=48701 RepID=UPI00072EEDEC